MLFHSFGGNDEVRYGGAAQKRSCAQIVIRLELLEDRFLLSGATGDDNSVVNSTPNLTSPALIGSVSPTPGTVSPPIQEVNASNGVASAGNVDKSTQNESAVVPASQQQAPAAADPSETQQNGSSSGASAAPGSAAPSGSGNMVASATFADAGSLCITNGTASYYPAVGSGTSSQTSAGVGSGTSSQSSSMNFGPAGSNAIPNSSSTQSPSISPPLPNPAGVPAGGIFRQVAANSFNATVGVLHIDPVASDLSTSGPATVGFSVSALSVYTGQPASLAPQPAPNIIGFRLPRPSLLSSSDSSPVVVSLKTAATAGRERAELPDIAELALIDRPVSTASSAPESPDPKVTDASLAALTTSAQEVALPAPPGLPGPIEPGESDTDDIRSARQGTSTNLVIYSASSLSMAASAPGLASMIRRGKRRDDRRPAAGTGDNASGSRR
jgi:hypothetical protein